MNIREYIERQKQDIIKYRKNDHPQQYEDYLDGRFQELLYLERSLDGGHITI